MNYQIRHAVERLLEKGGAEEARYVVSISGLTLEEAQECYDIIDAYEASVERRHDAIAVDGDIDDMDFK
jgi:hypothetical protein